MKRINFRDIQSVDGIMNQSYDGFFLNRPPLTLRYRLFGDSLRILSSNSCKN
jgi:hypothetical protein